MGGLSTVWYWFLQRYNALYVAEIIWERKYEGKPIGKWLNEQKWDLSSQRLQVISLSLYNLQQLQGTKVEDTKQSFL